MKLLLLLFGFTIAGIVLFAGCTQQDSSTDESNDNDIVTGPVELDAEKENTHLSKISNAENAYWMRSGWFPWNDVEPEEDEFDWDSADTFITDHLEKVECLLVVIFPFANWDQDTCHGEEYVADFGSKKGGVLKVGAPCDIEAYKNYLEKLVERYDGDGVDDMPGLETPVKYWEIMNEPSMQGGSTGGAGEELKFFVGTTEEYVETLKASYEAIKEADSDAKVLHAGIAGMDKTFRDFWDPIYSAADIDDYFDIANVHTISTDKKREDLYVAEYISFLSKYGLEDKPIWITEVQFGGLMEEPDDIESFNSLIVRSTVFSFALGADKLFYIESWAYWKRDSESTQTVCETLIDYMNDFDTIEILNQSYTENEGDYDGLTSVIGHYKVITGDEEFYVLWGDGELPDEIMGTIKVTDIYGSSRTIDASELDLNNEPVYVELV